MNRIIRVLVVDMPRMQHDLVVEVLRAEPGLDVVGMLEKEDAVPEAIAQSGADVVVADVPGAASDWLGAVLIAHPRLKVLGIDLGGERSALYELRVHGTDLGEVSPRSLVAAIRNAVGQAP